MIIALTNIGSGSWTVPYNVNSINVLIVGGGGGAGASAGGGGGGMWTLSGANGGSGIILISYNVFKNPNFFQFF